MLFVDRPMTTLPLISYIADSGLLSDFIHTRQIC